MKSHLLLFLGTAAGALAQAPVSLPEFFVTTERVGARELTVPRGDLLAPEPNPGQELLAIPGVSSHARSADAMEPNIRGLGFDRVATTFNGLPLVNASPERTNSPIVILGPAVVCDITVAKALPSVTLGPATSGGRIALSSEPAGGGPAPGASGTTTYHGGREGVMAHGRFTARAGALEASASGFANRLGHYRAADGRTVAAQLEEHGGSAALGWHGPTQSARVEFLQRRLRSQDALSLPLDGRNTESQVLTFTHRWTPTGGSLEKLETRAGHAFTDPYITNENRRPAALIFAQAHARTTGAGVLSSWRTGYESTLALGADFSAQSRRAVRTTVAGKDYIWPDARYEDAGAFAEWNHAANAYWRLRLGARGDIVRSDARDAEKPALGRPVREQFVLYNGAAAGEVARRDAVGALNALVEWSDDRGLSAYLGTGYSVQAPSVMERYRALLNALGGDGRGGNALELGNPALAPERNATLETGAAWETTHLHCATTLYYYRVSDFILRTRIGTTLPPLAPMTVFGYRNVDAEFLGGEAGVTFKPTPTTAVPLTLAVASGRNRTAGLGLAELPPWQATGALRHRTAKVPLSLELGARLVGARTNPVPQENPIFSHAGGFVLCHFRAGLPLGRRLQLKLGLENAFNRRFTEYLTPPVAARPASGDLLPGERIPGAGRALWAAITWRR